METSVGVGHEVTTFLPHGKALVRVWDFPLSRVWLRESEVEGKLHTVPPGLPVGKSHLILRAAERATRGKQHTRGIYKSTKEERFSQLKTCFGCT